jgi:hypothetical protein
MLQRGVRGSREVHVRRYRERARGEQNDKERQSEDESPPPAALQRPFR